MAKYSKSSRLGRLLSSLGFGREKSRSLAPFKRRILRTEPLEERALLSVLTWDPDGVNNGLFGGSGDWSAASAWVDTSTNTRYTWDASRSGDEAVFSGTAGTVNVNVVALKAAKLTFPDVGGYTISSTIGGDALTLNGSGVMISAAQSATINANLYMPTDQQWTVASGKTLTVGGGVDFAGRQLIIQGPGTTYFGSRVGGADFRVHAGGTATFGGSSSLTAAWFVIVGGTSNINWNSPGTLSVGVRLYVGLGGTGTFTQTNGTVTTNANDIEFSDASTYNLNGGIFHVHEINQYANHVVPAGCHLNFGNGTLLATGNLQASTGLSYDLAAGAMGAINTNGYGFIMSGEISGTGSLTKTNAGTLTFGSANTHSGTTQINAGTLTLNNSLALQNSTLNLNGGSLIFGTPTSATFGGLAGSSSLSLQNASTSAVALTVGGNNASTSYSGVLSGSGSLSQIGLGTLTLSGANTFTGITRIKGSAEGIFSNCVLALSNPLALQYSTVDMNSDDYGSLRFRQSTVTLGGLTGSRSLGLATSSATRPEPPPAPITLSVGNNNSSTTYSGTLNGPGSLTKVGTGLLTLSGTLNYTGQTTAAAGTINLLSKPTSWVESGGHVIGPGALNFLDSTLFQAVRDRFEDAIIDRTNMIDILTVAENGNIVTTNEFTDLQTIVANPYRLQMTGYVSPSDSGYVDVLAANIVNGNPANGHYQGSALGNLAANDSGTKLDTLIDKWFMGLDHPAAEAYTYQQATGSLFVGGPSIADMQQGLLGDCYFIASLGSIAERSVDAIENMFVDNGDNTWTVRFYTDSAVADYVTVDRSLPTSGSMLVYQNYGLGLSSELWMPLAEKAYAQWCETGNAERPSDNDYENLDGGHSNITMGQVLGESVPWYFVNGNQQRLNNALAAGEAVTITTYLNPQHLIGNHSYVVSGYSNGLYTLHNPHGPAADPGTPTWNQLVNDCSWFAMTDASGTNPFDIPPSPSGASVGTGMPLAALYAAYQGSTVGNPRLDGRLGLSTSDRAMEEFVAAEQLNFLGTSDATTDVAGREDAMLSAIMSGLFTRRGTSLGNTRGDALSASAIDDVFGTDEWLPAHSLHFDAWACKLT